MKGRLFYTLFGSGTLFLLIISFVFAARQGSNWEVIEPDEDIDVNWNPTSAGSNYDEIDEGIENADDDTTIVKITRSSLGTTKLTDWVSLSNTTAMFDNKTKYINITYRRDQDGRASSDDTIIEIGLIVDNIYQGGFTDDFGTSTWTTVTNWNANWIDQNWTKDQMNNMSLNFTGTVKVVGKAHTVDLKLSVVDVNITFTTTTTSVIVDSCTPPGSGDWVISDPCYINSDVALTDGRVLVVSGGSLICDNARVFNNVKPADFYILGHGEVGDWVTGIGDFNCIGGGTV